MEIKQRWLSWIELIPFKEQLIDMELELMIKYHYPDRIIPRTYPEKRVANLKEYLESGNTFFWAATSGDKLLGYSWWYVSNFIDKKRYNLRSIFFLDDIKRQNLGSESIIAGLKHAKELGCDEVATEYASWNEPMANFMAKHGFVKTRIEVIKII